MTKLRRSSRARSDGKSPRSVTSKAKCASKLSSEARWRKRSLDWRSWYSRERSTCASWKTRRCSSGKRSRQQSSPMRNRATLASLVALPSSERVVRDPGQTTEQRPLNLSNPSLSSTPPARNRTSAMMTYPPEMQLIGVEVLHSHLCSCSVPTKTVALMLAVASSCSKPSRNSSSRKLRSAR